MFTVLERSFALKRFVIPKKFVVGIVLILIVALLYFHSSAFMPFILAAITAFLLEPLVHFFQKRLKLKNRFPAVVIVFILFIMLLAMFAYLTITRLVNETIRFAERVPGYIVEITSHLDRWLVRFNETVANLPYDLIREIEKLNTSLINWATDTTQNAITYLAQGAQSIPNFVVVTIIYLIALFLISLDLPKFKEGFFNFFKEENAEKVRYMLQRSTRFFTGFFKAQFLVSIIIFIVSYVGLLIIAPKHALFMAFVIWFIDFVPFIGSIVVVGPWGLFHLISGNVELAIQLFVLAAILLVIRRTVEPKVMGDQIGLPVLPTLLGLWLGLYFFGVIGLIIGPLSIITLYAAKEAGVIKLDFKL